ncbi:signal transduction histidine kinase [Amorphus suaedae]
MANWRTTPSNDRDQAFLVSRSPPGRRQKAFALALVVGLALAAAVVAPVSQVALPGSAPFLAAYATAMFVNDLITAVLLFALFSVTASAGILSLATGYLVLSLTIIPWALTFPGALAPDGLFDAGLQGTATIAAVRRLAWPSFVIVYLLLHDRSGGVSVRRTGPAIIASVAGSVLAACALGLLATTADSLLPHLMQDARQPSPAWRYIPLAAVVLYAAALYLLWRRGDSVLDLWLAVAIATVLLEVVMLSYVSAGSRLSLGWWAGRIFGLVSASVVLFVLLSEMTALYARLVRATATERRAREARLASMEALSASIAHEVNQPLASMVTNADAGLRWLERDRPDLGEAIASFERIVREGHRAGHIVAAICSIFRKGADERRPVDLNSVVAGVARDLQRDVKLAAAHLELDLDPDLPLVPANRLQLEQVLANLLTNAIEAMARVERRRVVSVTTGPLEPGQVLVAVADSGPGIGESRDIFEAFVTSKSDGLGMGLMLCRSIVESHGGRIWTEPGIAGGAIFKFSLPAEGQNQTEQRHP